IGTGENDPGKPAWPDRPVRRNRSARQQLYLLFAQSPFG
ncbi:MAG: hypothetical protein ACKVLN_13300, partial [Rhodobacterales bacterium]